MATDPVRSIRRTSGSAQDLDLHDVLRDLAALPVTPETPYLTVTLDWTPDFENPGRRPPEEQRRSEQRNAPAEDTTQRPALIWFEAEARALLDGLDPRAPERAHLEADIAQVTAWLGSELDPGARGAIAVSSKGQHVFVPLDLGVPVPNGVTWGPLPSLGVMAHVAEDYETYAVLISDQDEAELMFVTQGVHEGGLALDSSLYPRKQASGGWSQRRYQARADERVAAFARTIADEVTTALRESRVNVLVLAGSEMFMHALVPEFLEEVQGMVAGRVTLDFQQHPGQQAIIEATGTHAIEAERAREAATVAQVRDLLGGGMAVAGAVDVINALKGGQVMTLVMNEDYASRGWADYAYPVYGEGEIPAEHPLGGNRDDIVEVALEEELIRFALQQGGEIELVHTRVPVDKDTSPSREEGGIPRTEAAERLDEVGGVAALLRFVS